MNLNNPTNLWGACTKSAAACCVLLFPKVTHLTNKPYAGMMVAMYIPTQEERYAKAPRWTLLLCLLVPSAVVMWFYGGVNDVFLFITAFIQPLAALLVKLYFNDTAALCLSALVQGVAFFVVARRKRLSAKAKLTICITWGMSMALLLRLLLAGWLV